MDWYCLAVHRNVTTPSPWHRKPLVATNIDALLDKHAGSQCFPQTGEERSKSKELNAFSDYNNGLLTRNGRRRGGGEYPPSFGGTRGSLTPAMPQSIRACSYEHSKPTAWNKGVHGWDCGRFRAVCPSQKYSLLIAQLAFSNYKTAGWKLVDHLTVVVTR